MSGSSNQANTGARKEMTMSCDYSAYLRLEMNEVIKDGDEYWGIDLKWHRITKPTVVSTPGKMGLCYRRPKEPKPSDHGKP